MAGLQLFQRIGRDCAAQLGAALNGQAVNHAELYLARLDLVGKQHFQRVLRHAGNHRADAVAAADADNDFIQLGIIDKVALPLHILNTSQLALNDPFKFGTDFLGNHNFYPPVYLDCCFA